MPAPTHGHCRGRAHTKEYSSWRLMKRRCTDKKQKNYRAYGGRGIKVHPRYDVFENFLEDVGFSPSKKHFLDRIDNNKNYEPGNLKWSTRSEQMRNTTRTIKITKNGETLCLKDWCRKLGISYSAVLGRARYNGITKQEAFEDQCNGVNRHRH